MAKRKTTQTTLEDTFVFESKKTLKKEPSRKKEVLVFDFADRLENYSPQPSSPPDAELESEVSWDRQIIPNPSTFHYPSLSLKDKAQIYYEMVRHCTKEGFSLDTCGEFVLPWLRLASQAIIAMNRHYGGLTRLIPLALTSSLAGFLFPVKDNVLWFTEWIGSTQYTFCSLGWCDHFISSNNKHGSYLVDSKGGVDRRTRCELFVIHSYPKSCDHVLNGVKTVRCFQLEESKHEIRISHVNHSYTKKEEMAPEMLNAVWKYGGLHETEGYPVPLTLFDSESLDLYQ